MLRSILIAFVCLPWAPAFAFQAAAPTAAKHEDIIDKVMGIVGPSEPDQLTEKKRFHLYVVSVAGPVPLVGEAVGAAISQWENSPKEWGQGWGAYGERYGSDLAYNAVRQTITYGTSVVFREDNRYFASRKHGFWPRTGYAILSTVTARHPDGRRTFSFSGVTGVFGASAISSIWGPRSWKGIENIGENAGISFAATAGFNIVREFLSDFRHRPYN
jgi:hypothetical protein